ncbi:MAG: mCpol domain-containing protein [Anaerolineae bacterium]|nr:mCpol domain-containing protein [Anaerolineae bacterium]
MTRTLYIAIDGDNIGSYIEYLFLMNNTEKLGEFSKTYELSMQWLVSDLQNKLGATSIFTGGDNSLLSTDSGIFSLGLLEMTRVEFFQRTGQTLSIGLGYTPREAYFALKLAKTSGKNSVRRYEELS